MTAVTDGTAQAREYAILAARLRATGHRETALAISRRAVRLAPTYADVVNQYSSMLLGVHQPELAITYAKKAAKLDPNLKGMCAHNIGLAQLYLGNLQLALDEFSRAESLDALCDRSHVLLTMGRWKDGFEAMELRRLHKPELYKPKKCREWDGREVDTVWVTTEQGAGDVFQFSRFIPWAATKCRHLIFSSHAQTVTMFQDFPGISEIRVHDRSSMSEPEADAHIPLMSLARLYGATPANIPSDPEHFKKISASLDVQLTSMPCTRKIGIVWAGNSRHIRDWERSISLGEFMPLVENPSLQLISLQVGSKQNDIEAWGLSQVVENLSDKLVSWPITASVLSRLDALVTCDTSVAHLAGALGVPTYLLICKLADWRWLTHRSDTPWYPSIKIIRQKVLGNWKHPMETVAHALEAH